MQLRQLLVFTAWSLQVYQFPFISGQLYVFSLSTFQLMFILASMCVYIGKGKVKAKVHLITSREGTDGEYRYDCTLSITSGLG